MKTRLWVSALLVLSLLACYPVQTFELDEAFTLAYRETQSNPEANLRIRFDRVLLDERCPIEYNCLVPGNAQVRLTFWQGNRGQVIVLNTWAEPRQVDISGYTIRLMGLAPANSVNDPPSASEYVVTVMVSKREAPRDTHCDDGTVPTCDMVVPVCEAHEILAYQNHCYVCVNPATCRPWGEPGCKSDADCPDGQYCDPCGTSSCPYCDNCIAACRAF